ncbi:hypothetical protein ACO0OE_000662 [Hanseniaspora uvarum]
MEPAFPFAKLITDSLSTKSNGVYSFKNVTLENHLKYKNSIKKTLSCLTTVGELSDTTFTEVIEHWVSNENIYKPIMIIDSEKDECIAIGTLLIETKIIHDGGKVGHIEDIAVNDDYQGKGLGKLLIQFLRNNAVYEDCYKVILDCDEKNVEFYNKCDFNRCGVEMQHRP